MSRKSAPVLPAQKTEDPTLVTEPEFQVGGPQSGLPPAFEIGQDLAPYLIVGIDFGSVDCRIATFMDKAPRPLRLSGVIETKIHFAGYATDANAKEATTLDVKKLLGKPFRAKVEGNMCSPVDLALPVFERVKRDAENVSERMLAKAVITTPACATHSYRRDLLEAAQLAEINVIGLLNETTALGLYWTHSVSPSFAGCFIALSLGEEHWEAAIMTKHAKLLEVRGHACKPNPGREAAEVETIRALVQQLIDDTFTPATDIKAIIWGGGASKEDYVTKACSLMTKGPVHTRLDHRAQAAGAAIFAALIVRQEKNLAVWDCLATATLVGEEFSIKPLIAEHSPVPISGHFNFKATADKLQFQVVQRAHDEHTARSVCAVLIEDIPATLETPRNIDVEVHATADGTLSFNARDIQLDSLLRIKIEPAITEYEVVELVKIEEKHDDASSLLAETVHNQYAGQAGIVLINLNGKWIAELVEESRCDRLPPGSEVLAIDGFPIIQLPNNPNLQFVDSPTKLVELLVRLPGKEESVAVSFPCDLAIDGWNEAVIQSLIAEAVLENDYAQLITATMMYAHACYSTDPEIARKAFDRAVTLAQTHLGTSEPLYTMASARKSWFHMKHSLTLAARNGTTHPDSLMEVTHLSRTLWKLIDINVETATDAHCKYLYELVCSFQTLGVHKPYAVEIKKLLSKAIEIAESLPLPDPVIETYKAKLAEFTS